MAASRWNRRRGWIVPAIRCVVVGIVAVTLAMTWTVISVGGGAESSYLDLAS